MIFPIDTYFGHLFFLPVQALGTAAWRAAWRALLEARWPSCRGLELTEEPRAFFERRRRAETTPELDGGPKSDDFEVLVEFPGEFQGRFRLLEQESDDYEVLLSTLTSDGEPMDFEFCGSYAIYVPFQCSEEKLGTMRLSLTLVYLPSLGLWEKAVSAAFKHHFSFSKSTCTL